jgi:tetratricopeptide (TPR) repeat protein
MAKKKRPDRDNDPGKKNDDPVPASGSPREAARELLDEAQFADTKEQARLARQALKLDPDLADAYLLLGRINPIRREALTLYQQALAAAQRSGDREALLESHLALAHVCWSLGRRDEAIQYGRELLSLEPRDSHTMRYTLAGWLLAQEQQAGVVQLIERYPEDSTVWNYTRALLAFRKEGDSEEARKLLKKARKSNKYVPRYLLQEELPGAEPPAAYTPGSTEEAQEYLASFLASWRATEGALDWLKQQGEPGRKRQEKESAPTGPTGASKKTLAKLRQHTAVWQVDCRKLTTWVEEQGRDVRPWVVLVNDQESHMIVGNDMLFQNASPAQVWDVLAQSMLQPLPESGFPPARPSVILFPARQPWQELQSHFQDIGIDYQPRDRMEASSEMFQAVNRDMGGQPEPGLLDVPGVTPERVRTFYEAAAAFYRQAPWRLVGYESAVEVRCSKFESGPWYAVVMGQSGLSLGVALYDNLKQLRRLWSDPASSQENARRSVATTVTFGAPVTLPIADVDAGEEHGWPVARSDAYPHVFHKDRGMSTRPPLAWELELLEACLRALPDFIRSRPQDDSTPEEVTVPAGPGQLTLTLSWIEDEAPRPSKARKRRRRDPDEPDSEVMEMLEVVQRLWPEIRRAHDESGGQKPIILLHLPSEQVAAIPLEEFKSKLDEEGASQIEEQYQQALQDDDLVIFVADHARHRVESFSLNLG